MTTRRSELSAETRTAREVSDRFKSLFVLQSADNPPIVYTRRGDTPRVLFGYFNALEEGFIHPGLSVLGGMMRDHSIDHELFDTSFWRDESLPVAENARQIRERMGEFKRVEGYDPERKPVNIREKFREHVERFRPDLIALGLTSFEFEEALNYVTPIAREFGIPVMVGGPHATVAPDKAILHSGVDIVCIGDGELPLLATVRGINQGRSVSNVPGLWLKDRESGNVLKNPRGKGIENLDDLPLPDWDMFDSRHRVRPFEGQLKNYAYIEISRGCPFKCSYCIQPVLHEIPGDDSSNYKFHTAENIISRVVAMKERFGFNHVQLIDENLPTMPLRDLEEISGLWEKHVNPNGDVTIFTMSRPEYLVRKFSTGKWIDDNGSVISSGKAEILKRMGVKMIAIGAESGSEWLRENVLRRPMQPGILEAASRVLKNVGIKTSLYNIMGFPEETREIVLETIDQLRRISPEKYSVRFLTPYPGTPIREYAIQRGFIEEGYEEKRATSFLHEPVLETDGKPTINGEVHPTKAELLRLRELFGIYGYSTSGGYNQKIQEMVGIWKVIELAEDRGLSKGNSELQKMVHQAFATARANRSEDEDSHRPDLDTRIIKLEDVPWANGDARYFTGHSKALLPVVQLAAGLSYAEGTPGLADLVRTGFMEDYEQRQGRAVQLDERQQGRIGIMTSGRG